MRRRANVKLPKTNEYALKKRLEDLRKMSDSFIGEVHDAIKNLPGSLPAQRILLNRAVAQLDALAAESGENPALEDQLAQAYFNWSNLPDMPLTQKDEILKKEIEIYRRLLLNEPQNMKYSEKLALAEVRLSDISKVRGRIGEAVEYVTDANKLLENIMEKDSPNADRQNALAESYFYTARLFLLEKKLAKSAGINEKEFS